ncbi:hypothetical protein B0H12DRAFT_764653 [Mycena haematopus]|nr:hypothetical protein B0H12DRAFT_764653 [Mycena haematopus]
MLNGREPEYLVISCQLARHERTTQVTQLKESRPAILTIKASKSEKWNSQIWFLRHGFQRGSPALLLNGEEGCGSRQKKVSRLIEKLGVGKTIAKSNPAAACCLYPSVLSMNLHSPNSPPACSTNIQSQRFRGYCWLSSLLPLFPHPRLERRAFSSSPPTFHLFFLLYSASLKQHHRRSSQLQYSLSPEPQIDSY